LAVVDQELTFVPADAYVVMTMIAASRTIRIVPPMVNSNKPESMIRLKFHKEASFNRLQNSTQN
jgi:hypothetical protein